MKLLTILTLTSMVIGTTLAQGHQEPNTIPKSDIGIVAYIGAENVGKTLGSGIGLVNINLNSY